MAVLLGKSGETHLPCRCLVGRSVLADIRLTSRLSSAQHAVFRWRSRRWYVRDLGSRNGTWLNQRRIQPGEIVALRMGDRVMFGGDEEMWHLLDDSGPEPCAVLVGDKRRAWGAESLLLIPSDDNPEASVFVDDDRWYMEHDGKSRPVECDEVVQLESGRWKLLMPDDLGHQSTMVSDDEIDLDRAELVFRVSRDEERVAATFVQRSITRDLPSRACLYTLVTLARVRLNADGGQGEEGWVSSQELSEMLKVSQEKLNLDVHRIRQIARAARVRNAVSLVQRHVETHQLRIGVSRLRVERL